MPAAVVPGTARLGPATWLELRGRGVRAAVVVAVVVATAAVAAVAVAAAVAATAVVAAAAVAVAATAVTAAVANVTQLARRRRPVTFADDGGRFGVAAYAGGRGE